MNKLRKRKTYDELINDLNHQPIIRYPKRESDEPEGIPRRIRAKSQPPIQTIPEEEKKKPGRKPQTEEQKRAKAEEKAKAKAEAKNKSKK